MFDKEAILQYIITKKTEYAKKLKEYERQKRIENNETAENDALEEHKKLMKFINTENNIVTSSKMSKLTCHGTCSEIEINMQNLLPQIA